MKLSFSMTYRFDKNTFEIQRNNVILNLRKDGFNATREYDRENGEELLVTNATTAQIAMSAGRGGLVWD